MDFTEMTIEQLNERRSAIASEIDAPDADLDALEAEARAINEEIEQRKAAETKRVTIRAAVAAGEGEVKEKIEREERKTMTLEEIRSSKEYINAFANYIKTGKDDECRALFTANAVNPPAGSSGPMPVPTVIEGRIRQAWERSGLLDLVRKTYVRGNLNIGFEISATAAAIHAEGANAPAEETLTLGVVQLVPASIKKWIRISDEALDMGGEEFLDYIYDELTYQIVKAAKAELIRLIVAAPAASTASAVGVPAINGAPGLAIIAQAIAQLADDSENIAVVMNRQTHAQLIAAMAAAQYAFDPFDGVTVHYDNTLPVYAASLTAAQTWAIVGDFSGAQMNFPNGDEVRIKFDDLSEAQADLVKIVGRMYVAIGVTTPGRFVKINGAA